MSQERATRWRLWMENPCFHEMKQIMDDIREESIADTDRVPTEDLTIAVVAEGRGIRRGLVTLDRRIEDMLD